MFTTQDAIHTEKNVEYTINQSIKMFTTQDAIHTEKHVEYTSNQSMAQLCLLYRRQPVHITHKMLYTLNTHIVTYTIE